MQLAVPLGLCVILALISVVYFRAGKAMGLRDRVAASAHGVLIASILPYGLLVDATTRGEASPIAQLPILFLLLLAVASIVYSVWALRGSPRLHVCHLLTLMSALPIVFLGSVAIVGWT